MRPALRFFSLLKPRSSIVKLAKLPKIARFMIWGMSFDRKVLGLLTCFAANENPEVALSLG